MKRLLITGAAGLLGSHLVRLAQGRFETLGLFGTGRAGLPGETAQVNLTDSLLLERTVRDFRPDIIIHAGAMTGPIDCEKRPDEATRVNVDATRQLASLSAGLGARYLFLSTDLVFDGQEGMYRENDTVGPLSHYASTKVEAERAIQQSCSNYMIVRTSLMVGYSPRGDRSVNEVIRRAVDRGETLELFVDEYRSVLGAQNLSEAILELAEREETGLLHVAGPERRDRYDWGMIIARHFGWDVLQLKPTKSADYKLFPSRPPDVSLDISKARNLLRTRIKTIEEVLRDLPK